MTTTPGVFIYCVVVITPSTPESPTISINDFRPITMAQQIARNIPVAGDRLPCSMLKSAIRVPLPRVVSTKSNNYLVKINWN